MKRKTFYLLGAMVCLLPLIAGCNNENNDSSATTTTDESLFPEWKKARDAFASYQGEYTYSDTNVQYRNDVLFSKMTVKTGIKNNEYYQISENYLLNQENVLEKGFSRVEVIKNINVDGKTKTKRYVESSFNGSVQKEGSYVSPNFINKEENYGFSFQEDLAAYYIETGDSYTSLIENINDCAKSDMGETTNTFSLSKTDGIITFSMRFQGEIIDSYVQDEDYIKTTFDLAYRINVENGAIASFEGETHNTNIYKGDKTEKSSTQYVRSLSYSFNTQEFESFSIETETTKNMYYGFVTFDVEGYPLPATDYAYVDETYSAEQAAKTLVSMNNLFWGSSSAGNFKEEYFKFYLDKECKTAFVEQHTGNDDRLNLYLKFDMPADKATIVTVFQNSKKSRISMVYIQNVGSTFNATNPAPEYNILSINGEEWKQGDSTSIQISENKTYVIVYDTPNLSL